MSQEPFVSEQTSADQIDPDRQRDLNLQFDPETLARFGRLELIARLVVEGLMAGRHRSPFKGVSVEFAEHRSYGPGDEIRHIDWRAYGKTHRYFVKQYEEETNLQVHLVLDTSASMAYSGRTVSKLEYARRLAAALTYLMIRQRDAVGLITFQENDQEWVPPRSAPGHFSLICQALDRAEPEGEPKPSEVITRLAERLRRRGLVIILTDAFDELDQLLHAIHLIRLRRHEVALFQILAPEEEEFPFRQVTRFRGLEAGQRPLRVDPRSWKAQYQQRLRAFGRELASGVRGHDADYLKISTETPPALAIMNYLLHRGRTGSVEWQEPGELR